MVSVMWFRRDLRIDDQKALAHAIASQSPTLCVFQFNKEQLNLLHSRNQSSFITSVLAFRKLLKCEGIDLYLMYGDLMTCFEQLLTQLKDWTDVYFNYDESGYGRLRDQKAAQFFKKNGIAVHTYQDHYLHGSQEIINQSGQPYKVFTPYYRIWQNYPKETPIKVELSQGRWLNLETPDDVLRTVESFKDKKYQDVATFDEASKQLNRFIQDQLAAYHANRDFPAQLGTSRLRIGAIGIRTVYHAVRQAPNSLGQATFLKELAWRDFYNMVYVAYPDQKTQPIQKAFSQIEWVNNPDWFQLWKEGKTGYPIVDAAMLQLQKTGWMHNRLRMIVASFLTKDLLCDWRLGEQYFQQQLIDYDAASNIGGWQWAASTGTDAVPYFRIFNPVTQGKRFDPKGEFIKAYLPQLEHVPEKYLHEPWKMPKNLQESVSCIIGTDYPQPIVDHAKQREQAIAKYEWAKEKAKIE
ncbi:TPA: deoxyribodipyrimidine photo-lyase [Streptococcus pyogenes]